MATHYGVWIPPIAARPKLRRVPIDEQVSRHRLTSGPFRARGKVFKIGETWHYEVRVGNKVVFQDNTGYWRPIIDACNLDILVASRVVTTGHRFKKSYPQLVEEAS